MNEMLNAERNVLGDTIHRLLESARVHDMYSGYGAKLYHAGAQRFSSELSNLVPLCKNIMDKRNGAVVAADLCAGSGRITAELSRMGLNHIFAVDLSKDILTILEKSDLDNVEPIQTDAIQWLKERESDSLDLVTIAAGSVRLFNSAQRGDLFVEILRVLRDDGVFWFTHECITNPRTIYRPYTLDLDGERIQAIFFSCPSKRGEERGAVNGYWVIPPDGSPTDLYVSWVRQITKQTLLDELRSAGFRNIGEAKRKMPRHEADSRIMLFFNAMGQ